MIIAAAIKLLSNTITGTSLTTKASQYILLNNYILIIPQVGFNNP